MNCITKDDIFSNSANSTLSSMVRVPAYPNPMPPMTGRPCSEGTDYCISPIVRSNPTHHPEWPRDLSSKIYGLYLHRDMLPVEVNNALLSFTVTRNRGSYAMKQQMSPYRWYSYTHIMEDKKGKSGFAMEFPNNKIVEDGYFEVSPPGSFVNNPTSGNRGFRPDLANLGHALFRLVLGAKIKNRSNAAWNDLHFYTKIFAQSGRQIASVLKDEVRWHQRKPYGLWSNTDAWINYSKVVSSGLLEGSNLLEDKLNICDDQRGSCSKFGLQESIRDIALYGSSHAEVENYKQGLLKELQRSKYSKIYPDSSRIYINPEDVEYYFAEINLTNGRFSIGKQEGSKTIIYKTMAGTLPVVVVSRTDNEAYPNGPDQLAYLDFYGLKFTSFIKSNSIELSAKIDSPRLAEHQKELSIDLPISSDAHRGNFGVYVFDPYEKYLETSDLWDGIRGTPRFALPARGNSSNHLNTGSLSSFDYFFKNLRFYPEGGRQLREQTPVGMDGSSEAKTNASSVLTPFYDLDLSDNAVGGRELLVGTRSLNDKYEFCSNEYKTFTIGFKLTNMQDAYYKIIPLVDRMNKIFDIFNIKFIGQIEFIDAPDGIDLFTLADGPYDFNFVVKLENGCCCGSYPTSDGCAYLGNSDGCIGKGWIGNLNPKVLARLLGHIFGAKLLYDQSLMDPFSNNEYAKFSSQSIEEITQGINNWCVFKGTGQPGLLGYVPPEQIGTLPGPPQVPSGPGPAEYEKVKGLVFDENLPNQIYLLESENIYLSIDATPINYQDLPVGRRTEVYIALRCRESQGCYIWEKKENGIWREMQKRIGSSGKFINIPFSILKNEQFWEIRCRVVVKVPSTPFGVGEEVEITREAISNVCKISRKPIDSIVNITTFKQVIKYPSYLPPLPMESMPESLKLSILNIASHPGRWFNSIWNNPLSENWEWQPRVSGGVFEPGQSYWINSIPPNFEPCPRFGGENRPCQDLKPEATMLPYSIDFYNLHQSVSVQKTNNDFIEPIFTEEGFELPSKDFIRPLTEEGFELPNYNIDNTWSYQIQDSDGAFVLDKKMVIPINQINNFNNIDQIYTYRNNKLCVYKDNYEFNDLTELRPFELYYFVSKNSDSFTLSYSAY